MANWFYFLIHFSLAMSRDEFLKEITGILKDSQIPGSNANQIIGERVFTKEEQMSRVLNSIIGDDTMDVDEIARNYYHAKKKERDLKDIQKRSQDYKEIVEEEEEKKENNYDADKLEDNDDDYTDIDDSGDEKSSKNKK